MQKLGNNSRERCRETVGESSAVSEVVLRGDQGWKKLEERRKENKFVIWMVIVRK